ncbi:MAG: pyrimidine/purine nucleoside phosphorylase [Bacteroidales bacterium]
MFSVTEHFDGAVKLIAYQTAEGKATIGMAKGSYTFGSSTIEHMTG